MSLPSPNLDDLRFQRDLVDEARRRIITYCPDWTDYNLSDPGITLIELFSWMTELMVYRMNQIPERAYIKFLELLGVQRRPASSAHTELTIWLSTSLPLSEEEEGRVLVPYSTEIMADAASESEPVTFSTDRDLTIVAPHLTQLRRESDFEKNYYPRLALSPCLVFDDKTKPGNTFYLGFDTDRDIRGHLLQLQFTCAQTQAVGIRREDPPWVWECATASGEWIELPPSTRVGERDTTGGLNNPEGRLVLYLPLDLAPTAVRGREAYWVRCRIEQRRPEQGMYNESPRVRGLRAYSIGATVPSSHAVVVRNEVIGESSGDPGQTFQLEHAPILNLTEDEQITVVESRAGERVPVPWQVVDDFSGSNQFDRHAMLDTATGEVFFGPAIRQPDGTVQQYGRIPEARATIAIARYRTGGGVVGNVPVSSLQTLTTSLAYVSRVNNLVRASGGRDPETLDELKLRAQRQLRAQSRAVTAEDYEELARSASRRVARVRCLATDGGTDRRSVGTVQLVIVPSAVDSLEVGDLSRLQVDEELAREIERFLDEYRLVSTSVRVSQPDYLGVEVHAQIVPDPYLDPHTVEARVVARLRSFLTPLAIGGEQDDMLPEHWDGWPYERPLYSAEIYSLIQRVPGVQHVLDVELYTRTVIPRNERPGEPPADGAELIPFEGRVLRVPDRTLLCSLDHQIKAVDMEENAHA